MRCIVVNGSKLMPTADYFPFFLQAFMAPTYSRDLWEKFPVIAKIAATLLNASYYNLGSRSS